jgi:hypothetical protein
MFPSLNLNRTYAWTTLQCEHGTTLRYKKQWYRTIRSSTESPFCASRRVGWIIIRKVSDFSRTLSQSLSTYPGYWNHLWSDYTLLIEMLADATPEVAATLRRLYIVAILRNLIFVDLLHHLIFHKLLGYIISSRTRFLYSMAWCFCISKPITSKNINSAWPRINFWIL